MYFTLQNWFRIISLVMLFLVLLQSILCGHRIIVAELIYWLCNYIKLQNLFRINYAIISTSMVEKKGFRSFLKLVGEPWNADARMGSYEPPPNSFIAEALLKSKQ